MCRERRSTGAAVKAKPLRAAFGRPGLRLIVAFGVAAVVKRDVVLQAVSRVPPDGGFRLVYDHSTDLIDELLTPALTRAPRETTSAFRAGMTDAEVHTELNRRGLADPVAGLMQHTTGRDPVDAAALILLHGLAHPWAQVRPAPDADWHALVVVPANPPFGASARARPQPGEAIELRLAAASADPPRPSGPARRRLSHDAAGEVSSARPRT